MKGRWKDTRKHLSKNKPWYKPPGWFKRFRRKLERHILNQKLKEGKEIPIIKMNNTWDWN